MPLIPEEEIERIKRETDLAAVVRSRGVALKPQGHDLIGLCPFHPDKSASLHVTPAKRLWRCVSCHATGNVIQFVQKFDGLSFNHTCELLKAGGAAVYASAPTGAPALSIAHSGCGCRTTSARKARRCARASRGSASSATPDTSIYEGESSFR